MMWPQLAAIGLCGYYIIKGRGLRQHCERVAIAIHIMADHLGMTDRQLKEIFDGLQNDSSPETEQSD